MNIIFILELSLDLFSTRRIWKTEEKKAAATNRKLVISCENNLNPYQNSPLCGISDLVQTTAFAQPIGGITTGFLNNGDQLYGSTNLGSSLISLTVRYMFTAFVEKGLQLAVLVNTIDTEEEA